MQFSGQVNDSEGDGPKDCGKTCDGHNSKMNDSQGDGQDVNGQDDKAGNDGQVVIGEDVNRQSIDVNVNRIDGQDND